MKSSGIKGIATLGFTLILGFATTNQAQENQLTPSEAAAGYDLLFNGKDLSNWHGYRTPGRVPSYWQVKSDGPLGVRIENAAGGTVPILADKPYKNFDVKIDVQTPVNGNSGIFLRYEEVVSYYGDARSGPEVQICGPDHSDCKSPLNAFGASYYMFAVTENLRTSWYNPPGSWNQIRVIAYDSNYVHYGNGKKLLEYKIGTTEFMNAYNASKYKSDGNNGRYYDIHAGGILLQHHGETGLTFRNLKAKELTVHPFKKDFANGKWPDTLGQGFVLESAPVSAQLKDESISDKVKLTSRNHGATEIRVLTPHSEFQALSTDGKALQFQRTSENTYSLSTPPNGAGIAIIRIRSEGRQLSKIISL
jgi:hypothetical protein